MLLGQVWGAGIQSPLRKPLDYCFGLQQLGSFGYQDMIFCLMGAQRCSRFKGAFV